MLNKTFCFFTALSLLIGGCAADVSEDERASEEEAAAAVEIDAEEAQDDSLDTEAAGEEMYDQMRCNKTCVLECGDCSCCL